MQAGQPLDHPPSAYVTALLMPQGGAIVADTASLEALGIRLGPVLPHMPSFMARPVIQGAHGFTSTTESQPQMGPLAALQEISCRHVDSALNMQQYIPGAARVP